MRSFTDIENDFGVKIDRLTSIAGLMTTVGLDDNVIPGDKIASIGIGMTDDANAIRSLFSELLELHLATRKASE